MTMTMAREGREQGDERGDERGAGHHSAGGVAIHSAGDDERSADDHQRSAEAEHEHEGDTDRASERDAQDCGRSAGDTTHSGYDLSCTGSAGDNDTNDTDDWLKATNHRTLWRGG